MVDQEITKVQELIYTTKVEAVMAPDVIVVSPSMSMTQVKELMRKRRIAGAPVADGDKVLGMLGTTEVMTAMEAGKMDSVASENMVTDVKIVSKDAYLVEVINLLGREGFPRLPVEDQDGKLVGILTTGTVIKALLHQMEISYQQREAERLQRYRASHIFQDIISDDTSLVLRYIVDDKDFANAGKASSMIKKSLQRVGVLPSIVRRVAVAVYEAEMNLVIHTDVGGEIIVDIRRERVHISAVDHGPGIEDLEQVLRPGYSTAPEWIRDMGFGAGMGLSNIKRCADTMKILSTRGGGTRLDIIFLLNQDSPG
ncbi:MAG: CBS domain-containing protein [Desulfomonile tiedjei]|nr:CBS domain-containing protein [Desulfomonile tiedjei]